MKYRTLCLGLLCLGPRILAAAPILGDIKTDHFGYRSIDSKIAFFSANPGPRVGIYDARSQSLAYSIPLNAIKDMGSERSKPIISGDHLWWVNFSPFRVPGTYFIYSASLNESSYSFRISDDLYQAPLRAALKSFYYVRCGSPKTEANGGLWNDSACHLDDAACRAFCPISNAYPGLNANYGTLDLSGGWHDAGDYEKKIGPSTNCQISETGDNGDAVWYLLTAYELNPGLFNRLMINLPETGNGLPDILNQLKWELDWYLKMQMRDYHVLEGVHIFNLGSLVSPPSADRSARAYSPPNFESEAIFCASLAHAARVFASLPAGIDFARTMKIRALETWNHWVLQSPDLDPHAFPWMPYGPLKVWAASEIFRMDPKQKEAQSIIDHYTNWELDPGSLAYEHYAMINYLQSPTATPAVQTKMKNMMGQLVNKLFALNDLYNSGMAPSRYSWGSNQFKADTGIFLAWAARLNATGSYSSEQCLNHAEDYLHYFHGDNPLNMVYMTNTDSIGAKHCVWQIYNSWFGRLNGAAYQTKYVGKPRSVSDPLYPYSPSDTESSLYGPPPGFVPDGPSYQYFQLGGDDVPPDAPGPSEAPYAKAYRDYNKISDMKSQPWIVNEAGINQNASYLLLCSFFADAPPPVEARSRQ